MSEWTLFSNYGHVLIYLAKQPKARLRDVAEAVGITERAVQTIVHDLQEEDFISIRKQGRRNQYQVNRRKSLRHSVVAGNNVGRLLKLLQSDADQAAESVNTESVPASAESAPAELDQRKSPPVKTRRKMEDEAQRTLDLF